MLISAAMVVAFVGVVTWSTMLGLFLATTWSAWVPLIVAIPVSLFLMRRNTRLADLSEVVGRTPLWAIFGVGLFLRVTWAVFSDWQPISDALEYEQMAMDILDGNWSLNANKPKGPSYFLALHYALFGVWHVPPMITQSVLSAIQICFVHDVILAAHGGTRSAKMAAALLATWPEHVLYVDVLGSDTLFGFLVLLAAWLVQTRSGATLWSVMAAGAALGWSQWMRPTGVVFLVAMWAAIGVLREIDGRLWQGIRQAIAMAAGAAVPIGLIVCLNVHSFGRASVSPAWTGGFSMLVGTNISTSGAFNKADRQWFYEEIPIESLPPDIHPAVYRDRLARQKAWDRIEANPVGFATSALVFKMYGLWGSPATLAWPLVTSRLAEVMRIQWVMAIALLHYAIAALFLACRGKRSAWESVAGSPALFMLLLAALATTVAHFFLESQSRYHFAFVPLLAMLLSLGSWRELRQSDSQVGPLPVG